MPDHCIYPVLPYSVQTLRQRRFLRAGTADREYRVLLAVFQSALCGSNWIWTDWAVSRRDPEVDRDKPIHPVPRESPSCGPCRETHPGHFRWRTRGTGCLFLGSGSFPFRFEAA